MKTNAAFFNSSVDQPPSFFVGPTPETVSYVVKPGGLEPMCAQAGLRMTQLCLIMPTNLDTRIGGPV
jgi:hypothetical protein